MGALSGKLDPFSRPTPLPQGLLQKYKLGRDVPASELEGRRVKSRLQQGAELSKHARGWQRDLTCYCQRRQGSWKRMRVRTRVRSYSSTSPVWSTSPAAPRGRRGKL
ncbi:uncharacterized protein LOC144611259 isoform X2 [Rhinoraja longicauda]